jgi:hypothetical protein
LCVWLMVQVSAATVPACKWVNGVCMRCVWYSQHAHSPWQADLVGVEDSWLDGAEANQEAVCASSRCLRRGTSYVFTGSFWGRRPEAIAAENGEVPPLYTLFHTLPQL